MDRIVVIGGGGHAKVVISVLKKSAYDIVGYTDGHDRGALLGVPYLGNDGILPEFIKNHGQPFKAIVGVGKIDVSSRRIALQKELGALGFDFPVIISPHAIVNEEVSLGPGTIIFDGVVVNSGTEIGKACIINSNSTVEHDCHIGENVHIAPGATLSGGVTIGDNCMIGTGANIIQSISICEECLIGAGSNVFRDITSPGIYMGTPARKIR
jgi:sugar O-acyltransferase (sialic acid O-acetyltransferase NeuD family)